MCSHFFPRNHKIVTETSIVPWTAAPRESKEFHHQTKTILCRIFLSSKPASQNRFEHMQTEHDTEVGFYLHEAELCVPNKFKSEKPVVDFPTQWYHADLARLYMFMCKMNFKFYIYLDNLFWIGKCSKLKVPPDQISMVPLERKINYRFFTLEYIWYTKFCKKIWIQPSWHVRFACARIFFLSEIVKMLDINCSLDYSSSGVKNSIIKPKTGLWRIFFIKVCQSEGRFEHMQTKHARGWIHIFCRTFCTEYIQEWKIYSWFFYPIEPLSCRSDRTVHLCEV